MNKTSQPIEHSEEGTRLANFIATAWRGFFMGAADVVPGVSGGTVALMLGIYERLVGALSRCDMTLLRHVLAGRFKQAATRIDLFFLVSLACGIFCGLVAAIFTINRLLDDEVTRQFTLAAFFGMILASGIHIARLIDARSAAQKCGYVLVGLVSAAAAYWVSSLTDHVTGEPSLLYLFLCGCVAICAMILPGISGAMILLLLGVYEHLTDIPKQMLHGEHVTHGLLTIAVFGMGCAISLIGFSKFLRWLLERYHSLTMALLCGLLFGGLRKLWPFAVDLSPEIEEFRHKHFAVRLPESAAELLSVLGVALLAGILMVVVEQLANRIPVRCDKQLAASRPDAN